MLWCISWCQLFFPVTYALPFALNMAARSFEAIREHSRTRLDGARGSVPSRHGPWSPSVLAKHSGDPWERRAGGGGWRLRETARRGGRGGGGCGCGCWLCGLAWQFWMAPHFGEPLPYVSGLHVQRANSQDFNSE